MPTGRGHVAVAHRHDRAFGDLVAIELADDRALAHHHHAMAQADELGNSDEMKITDLPWAPAPRRCGRSPPCRRRRRRASARRRSSSSAPWASHLAITTFCWLPPTAGAPPGGRGAWRSPGGRSCSTPSPAPTAPTARPPGAPPGARAATQRDVLADAEVHHVALRLAVLGEQASPAAIADSGLWMSAAAPCTSIVRAALVGPEDGPHQFRAPGTDQPGDAEHLAGVDLEGTVVHPPDTDVTHGEHHRRVGHATDAVVAAALDRRLGVPCPVISAISARRSRSLVASSATTRALRITTTRSVSVKISSRRCET